LLLSFFFSLIVVFFFFFWGISHVRKYSHICYYGVFTFLFLTLGDKKTQGNLIQMIFGRKKIVPKQKIKRKIFLKSAIKTIGSPKYGKIFKFIYFPFFYLGPDLANSSCVWSPMQVYTKKSGEKGGGTGGEKPSCYSTRYGYGHEFKSLVHVDDHNMEMKEWGCVKN
jgi:hypothetical protein